MRKMIQWIASGMLVMGIALPVLAADKPAKADKPAPAAKAADKPAKPTLAGKWQQMATVLNLNEEQQKTLGDKVKAMNDGLKQFEEANAAKIKASKEQADALATERKTLSDKLNADVMSVFTPEQLQKVSAAEMAQRAAGRNKLTADQQTKAMELATAAVKALAEIKADDKEASAKKAEITRKFDAEVQAMLTPEQKQAAAADDVLREAKKGMKATKLTPESEKAVNEAAVEASKKIADLDAQKAKVVADLKAKIEAEAAKTPAPAPKPEKKPAEKKPAAKPAEKATN